MPNITDNSFQRLSDPIIGISERFTHKLLRRIKEIMQRVVRDPSTIISVVQETNFASTAWDEFEDEADSWADVAIAEAYLKGIKATNGQVPDTMVADQPISSTSILAGGSGGGSIGDKARSILDKYPKHHTMYTVFKEQTYQAFKQTRLPVIRDVQGKIRNVITETSNTTYRNADEFTRRRLSQDLMNRFAKENIAGIRYADGRTMKIDTYSEMVARSQTGNAAREAAFRRQEEYGLDLLQISAHYPCSDLCIDWQGRVYSISGTDDKYPPIEEAISGGLYHSNCKHSQSAYIPGTSKLPEKRLTKTENRKQYQAQQKQRYNERKIREWKRRKAGAMTDAELNKANGKIRAWQKRQRDLVKDNSFLRRKYAREQVN